MSNILNPSGAPSGGHAGYGKGADAEGTEAQQNRDRNPDPITKDSDAMGEDGESQTSQWKEKQ